MQAGSLNKYIEVYSVKEITNEYGSAKKEYTLSYKTKAQIKYLSGNKTINAKEIFFTSKVSFTIRKQNKITESDRIKYNNKFYTIDYITESDLNSKTITTDLVNE